MYQPYVRVSTGSFFTQLDSAAKNPLGCIYSPPVNQALPSSAKGLGAQPVVKYVYYNSTSNPAPEPAPAPVYWTDESFTTVSGNANEAFFATGGACVAGYLLPNTVSYSGLTATILNQSYCWIQIGGLLVGAFNPSTQTGAGVGSYIVGNNSGNWASTVNTTQAASTRTLGVQWSAIANGVCDVLVGGDSMFWGS